MRRVSWAEITGNIFMFVWVCSIINFVVVAIRPILTT